MAGVSQPVMHSPLSLSQQQQMLPTPSPFTDSLASSVGWRSSQPTIDLCNIFLRLVALSFSVVSFLTLFAPLPRNNILDHLEFRYCLSIGIFASIYSGSQLLKGIHDIAFKFRFISDNVYDHFTFIVDQLVAYLLMSSSSAAVPAIRGKGITFKKVAITSVSMSFAAFLVVAFCALMSGYKLCKRLIW